jgi:hypothetical protein
VNRHRFLDGLAFLSGFSRPRMFFGDVDAGDNHFVFFRQRSNHSAFLAFVFTGYDYDIVPFFDFHDIEIKRLQVQEK